MFGTASIVSAKFSPDRSKLTVTVNVKVNSTGWKVEQSVEKDAKGMVTKVTLSPVKPTGLSGCGFPSNGQEFACVIGGPFATSVEINTNGDSKTAS